MLLAFSDAELLIQVIDHGLGAEAARAVPVTPGSGHGLIGKRERVAVFGGQLGAGPSPTRGYDVQATLHLPAGRRSGPHDCCTGPLELLQNRVIGRGVGDDAADAGQREHGER